MENTETRPLLSLSLSLSLSLYIYIYIYIFVRLHDLWNAWADRKHRKPYSTLTLPNSIIRHNSKSADCNLICCVLLNMLQMDCQHSVWGDTRTTSFPVLWRASHEGTVRDQHLPPGRNVHIVQHAHQNHRAHVSLWVLSAKFLWERPLVHSSCTNHNRPHRSVYVQDICKLFQWCLLVVTTKLRIKVSIHIWNRYYLERHLCNIAFLLFVYSLLIQTYCWQR